MSDIMKAARKVEEQVNGMYRFFHTFPRTSWNEMDTIIHLQAMIKTLGSRVPLLVSRDTKNGLVVDMVIRPGEPFIVLRADLDALPIQEATGLLHASRYPGVMHACGHDAHSAMLFGALSAIAQGHVNVNRNLRFFWQRGEESPNSGAKNAIASGVLDHVERAFGLHVWPDMPVGVFQGSAGPMFAQVGRLEVKVTCRGGHAMDADVVSATDVLADLNQEMRILNKHHLDPDKTRFCCTMNHAGDAFNVKPAEGTAMYSWRDHLSQTERERDIQKILATVRIAEQLNPGATITAEMKWGCPVLNNDGEAMSWLDDRLEATGLGKLMPFKPFMGGEDFAYFTLQVPSMYTMLGAHAEGSGPIHSPTFQTNEDALPHGVAYWLAIATS